MKDRIRRAVVSQFMRPHGIAGRIAGWEMALRASNRKRNVWAVGLLEVAPDDRVLEVGFGPGVAIGELARRASRGLVVGVDHSDAMVALATSRNRRAVRDGRVRLVRASADDLPAFDVRFDKVLAVNNIGMWQEPARALSRLRDTMAPDGRIAIVSQPRCPGATADTTAAAGRRIREQLAEAGFVEITSHVLELQPPVVCVIGRTSIEPRE